MKLPDITAKQVAILELIYRFRFVNRIQIQALMHHRDYRRINAWLKDLREKQYVEWIYSDHFLEKTKPAIYYLGINGVRKLRQMTIPGKGKTAYVAYPITELRKRYRDKERSEAFISRSVTLAACCIDFERKTSPSLRYGLYTQADYAHSKHGFQFLHEAEGIQPSLCIVRHDLSKGKDVVTNYLLELFDPTVPHYTIRYRIKRYIEFIDDDEWESGENDPQPIILLVCTKLSELIYAKRRAKKVLDGNWYDEDGHGTQTNRPRIRFTTMEQLKKHGITAAIWEEGRKVYGV